MKIGRENICGGKIFVAGNSGNENNQNKITKISNKTITMKKRKVSYYIVHL